MRSCGIGAKSSRAARCTSCARRASAATSSKAWPSRSPTSTRSSPPSRRRRRPRRRRSRLMSRAWTSGAVPEMLARAGAISTRPDGEIAALGIVEGGYRLTETQAQAILEMRLQPAHRARAGQDHRRVPGAAGADPRSGRHSRAPGAPARGHPQRAGIHPRHLRRQAPHRDHRQSRRSHHRGSDFARGRGGDAVARRLRQGAAGVRLPGAAPRRPRQGGDQRQGRGLRRQAVRGEHPRHAAVLLRPRQAVLAQGVSAAAGEPRLARQAHRESAAAAGGRAHQRHAVDQGVRRRQVRVHGDQPRHGEEDLARPVLAAARERHHRGGARSGRQAGGRRHHRRHQGHPAVHHRRQGDPLRRGRGAADGPRGGRRARRQAQRGAARQRVDRGGAGLHPHRIRRTASASSRRSRISRSTAAAARASSRCRSPTATAAWSARCR